MATYGEGDPTDNAQDFYDWLQETDVDLTGVKFAVSLHRILWQLPRALGLPVQTVSPSVPPQCDRAGSFELSLILTLVEPHPERPLPCYYLIPRNIGYWMQSQKHRSLQLSWAET